MQVGSLVECIKYDNGNRVVDWKNVKLADECKYKEILTIIDISKCPVSGNVSLRFLEKNTLIHPVLNVMCGYNIDKFREIQPPMSIPEDIQEIISSPINI